MNLKEQLKSLQTSMQGIVDGAKEAHRDLTDPEMSTLEAKAAEAVELKAKIERAEKSAELLERIGGQKYDAYDMDGNPVESNTGNRWAQKAVDGLSLLARSAGGVKSLTSGSVSVPAILSPVLIDTRPRTLLDLIPVLDPRQSNGSISRPDQNDELGFIGRPSIGRTGNGFSFIRQNVRTNNAGAVPDGGAKPTSQYTFGQVDDTYRVYANKTEHLPWRYLDDFRDLVDIVSVQLREDTLAAIEADVLSGDGEEDRFTGILETSGIQSQAFTTDLLTTLSTAKYKLLAQDRKLTGWAFNPFDLQALEMLRENGSTGAFLFKSRAEIEDFLAAPIVTSLGLPTGEAIAADWNQSELLPLGDDELVFDGKKRTDDNTFLLMFEGRYGFRVKKPFDFVKVSLSA
ncbi:phage major capsid protein [Microbacterium terregens]|uniref:Phage major capsid protein n=1 Tax=Microbacterium terregens TaxID=69363 RepID=A0ABV5SXJ8_9MICO